MKHLTPEDLINNIQLYDLIVHVTNNLLFVKFKPEEKLIHIHIEAEEIECAIKQVKNNFSLQSWMTDYIVHTFSNSWNIFKNYDENGLQLYFSPLKVKE